MVKSQARSLALGGGDVMNDATRSAKRAITRLEIRIDSELKKSATRAALLANCDLNNLVIRGLAHEIRLVESNFAHIRLKQSDFERFQAFVESTRPMGSNLMKAASSLQQEGFDLNGLYDTEQKPQQ